MLHHGDLLEGSSCSPSTTGPILASSEKICKGAVTLQFPPANTAPCVGEDSINLTQSEFSKHPPMRSIRNCRLASKPAADVLTSEQNGLGTRLRQERPKTKDLLAWFDTLCATLMPRLHADQ